jgi:transposase
MRSRFDKGTRMTSEMRSLWPRPWRPTTRFVPAKSNEQLDLQALHRLRSRLVGQRTAVINQIRGFLLERGIIVRQGLRFLRQLLPDILAKRTDVLSPRMVRIVSDLAGDWRQLDDRIETVTDEIETLAKADDSCRRVMTVPGIGPIISRAMGCRDRQWIGLCERAGLFGLARGLCLRIVGASAC